MPAFLVDSNVLLDIITRDPHWADWSEAVLQEAADRGRLVINPMVYAEVSIRFTTVEELEDVLPVSLFDREDIPFAAAFLAGKCFVEYRKRGGNKLSPLPDFFIGAHAAVASYTLISRDAGRYRTYFPQLELISP